MNIPLLKTLYGLADGPDETVIVRRRLVEFTGSLEAGMMLNQLMYWTPRGSLKNGWIAKSDKDWQKELFISRRQVRNAADALVKMGIIEKQLRKFAGAPTTHYRIIESALIAAWAEWIAPLSHLGQSIVPNETIPDCPKRDNGTSQTEQSSTEITTEITFTKITTEEGAADAARAFDPDDESVPIHGRMFEALSIACRYEIGVLTEKQRGQLNQTEKKLRQVNATPAQVIAFGDWWPAHDWRGKRNGEAPCPSQVREEWGRFMHWWKKSQATEQMQADAEALREERQAEAETLDPDLRLAQKTWQSACRFMRGSMEQTTYRLYIEPLVVLKPNGVFRLQAPPAIKEWVDHRLRRRIEEGLRSAAGREVTVELIGARGALE